MLLLWVTITKNLLPPPRLRAKSKWDLMGDIRLDAKAGRINLSQYPRHDHIPNLFHDPDLEPSLKPTVSLGTDLAVHTSKGTESEELGEEKQKLLPGNSGPDWEGKSWASWRMLCSHPIRAVSQFGLIWSQRFPELLQYSLFLSGRFNPPVTQHPANCFHLCSSGEGLVLACTQKKLRKVIAK